MASVQLGSDTLTATPSAGQQEYNGTIFTAAPTSTTRGIIPTEQFYSLNSGFAGANATGAQSIFGLSNGVTLAGSTQYEFEYIIALSKTAGTTSHTVSIGFGGTATLNNIIYQAVYDGGSTFNTLNTSTDSIIVNTASSTVITGAQTSATNTVYILTKGTVSVNSGGTFNPQYTLSAAPGGAYTTQVGSYMKIKPIGASGANVSVGTWS
jgi:hypothetical protein